MAGQKTFIFDPQDLYALITHYTDGAVPLYGKIQGVARNKYLDRVIGLLVDSDEWQTEEPLHIRYDGRMTATWTQGQERADWAEREETPKFQP